MSNTISKLDKINHMVWMKCQVLGMFQTGNIKYSGNFIYRIMEILIIKMGINMFRVESFAVLITLWLFRENDI